MRCAMETRTDAPRRIGERPPLIIRRVEHSEGSLYLWCTRDEPGRVSVDWLAERGILVAPGDFYGAAAGHHVRAALTATNERIDAAVRRLTVG